MNKLIFFACLLAPSLALADDPKYMVDVNAYSVTGETDNPKALTVTAGSKTNVKVDGVSCSLQAYSFGVVAQCGAKDAAVKCNNTMPGNTDSDDSLQVTKNTKILLKCKTSADPVK